MTNAELIAKAHTLLDCELEEEAFILCLIQLFIFSGDNSLRRLIHQASLENLEIFRKSRWSERWMTIYKKEILKPSDYEDTDVDSLMMKVQVSWAQFLTHDLPKIREIISKIS